MRLIDADTLKKHKFTTQIRNGVAIGEIEVVPVAEIDNAPTVEPFAKVYYERPHGEWKETGYETGALGITYRQTQCSNCGWEHALPVWWNFCPNCGAEMQKGGAE